jgi:HK97 family phage portal protein
MADLLSLGLSEIPAPTRSERRNIIDNPTISLASPAIWDWLTMGEPTAAGELVNESTSLQIITVYRCVRILGEAVAALPLKLYERLAQGRQEATSAALYSLLAYEPNPEMTAFTFFETGTGCLALTGNCYSQIERNDAGQPVALWPLHPLKTEPFRLPSGEIAYRTSDGMNSPGAKPRIIDAADIIHIPLFSYDGLKGLSPIALARQGLGLSRAAEKYGARFFGNGSKPSGIMMNDRDLDEVQTQNSKENWERGNGGANQGKTAFLWGGWKYQQIGLSPEESQFLETRNYQRAEIAGLFGIPPHMVGDTARLSNGNHEQQALQFVTDTLRPYLCRWEQEIIRKLMPSTGRNAGRYFVQFDVSERLRGDFQTTMAGYATGRQWGWYSVNDVKTELGDNPIGPKGDIYLVPVNMMNADLLIDSEPIAEQPLITDGSKPQPDAQQQTRDALGQYKLAFINLFRDGVGRVCARGKRDSDAIRTCFGPILESLSGLVASFVRSRFGLDDAWQPKMDTVNDLLKGIEKRAASWSQNNMDEATGAELTRSIRGLLLAYSREAGAAIAVKELPDETA